MKNNFVVLPEEIGRNGSKKLRHVKLKNKIRDAFRPHFITIGTINT